MKRTRQILAMLLCAAMLLTLAPLQAFTAFAQTPTASSGGNYNFRLVAELTAGST